MSPATQSFSLPPRRFLRFFTAGLILLGLIVFKLWWDILLHNQGASWLILLPPSLALYALFSALLPRRFVVNSDELESRFWLSQHLLQGRDYGRLKAVILLSHVRPYAVWMLLPSGKRVLLADDHSYSIEQLNDLAHWLSQNTGARLYRAQGAR
jgi:hypothetical protein